MDSVKDRVIVLRTIKYSEADLVIHCLNQKGGRLNFIAKSARKSRRRFGGGLLEPTHFLEVTYKPKAGYDEGGLNILEDARLLEGFTRLREDYQRLETALYFLQLMGKVSLEGISDSPDIFHLLGHALRAAETSQKLQDLRLHFEMRFLYLQGVLPPEMAVQELLQRPISEHGLLQLEPEEIQGLHGRLNHLLQQYLGH